MLDDVFRPKHKSFNVTYGINPLPALLRPTLQGRMELCHTTAAFTQNKGRLKRRRWYIYSNRDLPCEKWAWLPFPGL